MTITATAMATAATTATATTAEPVDVSAPEGFTGFVDDALATGVAGLPGWTGFALVPMVESDAYSVRITPFASANVTATRASSLR